MQPLNSKFTLKLLNEQEFVAYNEWYEKLNSRPIPKSFKCTNVVGAEIEGVLAAAITLNMVIDCNACLFTYVTKNPYIDKQISSEAIDFLLQNLGFIAGNAGYAYYASIVGEPAAVKRYDKNGIKNDGQLTLFWGVSHN